MVHLQFFFVHYAVYFDHIIIHLALNLLSVNVLPNLSLKHMLYQPNFIIEELKIFFSISSYCSMQF